MNQLELLWDLENHNNELENLKKRLALMINNAEIKALENRIKELETDLVSLREKLSKDKKKLREYEKLLVDYNYRKNTIDNDLYKGNIRDLKQLDYLSKEKEKINNFISEIEDEIIFLMEDIETMDIRYSTLEESLNNIREEVNAGKKNISEIVGELQIKISKEIKLVNKLNTKVEKKIIEKYYNLRENRGKGIVSIKNSVCSGCNMHIPTSLIDAIRNKSQIVCCESCGRILYYIDNTK